MLRLCWPCLGATDARPATLTLVNVADVPVGSAVVAVPATPVYRAMGIASGRPIAATGEDGRPVPCRLDPAEERLLLRVSLPAGARHRLSLAPTAEWASPPLVQAAWDEGRGEGRLTSGALTLRVGAGGAALALVQPGGKEAALIEGLHFYGWLDDRERVVPGAAVAEQWGLASVGTARLPVAAASATADTEAGALQVTREGAGGPERIRFTETFRLDAWSPVLTYRLRIENRRGRPVWVSNCDGLFHARFGQAMAAPKRILYPPERTMPVTDHWLMIGDAQIPEAERTWMAVRARGGPALGFASLSPRTDNWAFTRQGFWLYQCGPNGERPVRIEPGQSIEWGVAFLAFPDAGDAVAATQAYHRAWQSGVAEPGVVAGAPVAVFLEGKPLAGARVAALREDFHTVDRWVVGHGRVSAEASGAVLAAEDGNAEAACALRLDMGRRPWLEAEASALTPGAVLQVAVQPLDGEPVILAQARAAGQLHADVAQATGWAGPREFALTLRLTGPAGARATLRSLSLGPAPLSAPLPRSPQPGQRVTDLAVFHKWTSVPGAEAYDLQLSREPTFARPASHRAGDLGADVAVWFPEKPLEAGRWHWRVRGVDETGLAGRWSGTQRMEVDAAHPKRPPKRPVSPERPLFVLHSITDVARAWRSLPEDLRPYCALRVETDERGLDPVAFCRAAERAGANVILQCSGPGGGVLGEIYREGKRYGRASLADVEWAFQHCPHVLGATIVEQFFHHFVDPTSREYALRLLALCAKYGRLLMWADGHWGSFGWLRLGSDPKMLRTLAEYRQYLIPLWKMNCGDVPLTIHGAVMGLWLSGVTESFGVEPEGWYWHEAGYGRLGEVLQPRQTDQRLCPPALWGQMVLLGTASGAACYCLESWTWVFQENGETTEVFKKVIAPLLQAVVRRRLIPSRQSAQARVKMACRPEVGDLAWSSDFGALRGLYAGTYGLRHDHEMIPNSGRFFPIALLPPAGGAPPGVQVVRPADLRTPEAARERLGPLYPEGDTGDAFVSRVGDTVVVMNTQENADIAERFQVPLGAPFGQVSGTVGPHHYVVLQQKGRSLWLHANTYPDRPTELRLRSAAEPRVRVLPAGACLEGRWDAGTQEMHLRLSHRAGAAEATLEAR